MQLSLQYASQARDTGMNRAEEKANRDDPDFTVKALDKLREYLNTKPGSFMVEDLRAFAAMDDKFVLPENARAWGGIITKANRMGLITHAGLGYTKNPLAHRTPAAKWEGVN